MRLDPFVRDYRGFMEELAESLEKAQTRFYLDTSVLMWLIRLGTNARSEFTKWCASRPAGTIRVPVWAAHELHRHLIGRTVSKGVLKIISDAEAKMDDFVRLAAERADEASCRAKGYAGRASYISDVEQSFERLKTLSRIVALEDNEMRVAADQVVEFVNRYVLSTDLESIVTRLGEVGEFRYSHLMPPGYQDKKDENRYGDVIVWEEMMLDLISPDKTLRHRAILISRDDKTDWVSSAPLIRINDQQPRKANRDLDEDVTRAHPLLVHEFDLRVRGEQLYVMHPGYLAYTLDYIARRNNLPSTVKEWMAASHRPDLVGRLGRGSLDTRRNPAGSTTVESSPTRPQDAAAADLGGEAQFVAPTRADFTALAVTSDVRAYQQASTSERSSLLTRWISLLLANQRSTMTLGKVLAELVIDGDDHLAASLTALVEHLSSSHNITTRCALVFGVIVPAYFNRYGELRRKPINRLGTICIMLERQPDFNPAFRALAAFLSAAGAQLPYLPGTGRSRVAYVLDLAQSPGNAPREVRDIRIGNQSALIDPLPDGPRTLSSLLNRPFAAGCTGMELRSLLSNEYLIPSELMDSAYDAKRLTWPATAGLVSLDAESPGGLSTFVDDEKDDIRD